MEKQSLKQQIVMDLDILEEMGMLLVVWQFVELMKQQSLYMRASENPILKHAGRMSEEDADEISSIVNREFNNIEGEW